MFTLQEDSVDDLMRGVLTRLLDDGYKIAPSKGPATEMVGAALVLTNPLARLSRSENRSVAISALGELIWYLSGSDLAEPISYYIPFYSGINVDGRIEGAYGPRLFGDGEQLQGVINLLKRKQDSRRAVLQIYDESDMANTEDVPCTCTLQFFAREDGLHLVTYMRSNDAFMGLPHDIFCFTMLQEIVARSVGLDLGPYTHFVGSLHLYNSDLLRAKEFLAEGWHVKKAMPPMPEGDPWPDITALLQNEQDIRTNIEPLPPAGFSNAYWEDLAQLLIGYRKWKSKEPIGPVVDNLVDPYFQLYLNDRQMREGDR